MRNKFIIKESYIIKFPFNDNIISFNFTQIKFDKLFDSRNPTLANAISKNVILKTSAEKKIIIIDE